ncbi:MAG: ribbon-helix-helix protein, CopG family [Acidimicrobiia bacterium]
MRRINIHLDDELDAELAAEAARTGQSKASLLRRAARAWLDRRAKEESEDAWSAFTGAVRGPAGDDTHDDDVIYRA